MSTQQWHLGLLVLRELFGSLVEHTARALSQCNASPLSYIRRSKGDPKALAILMQHNLVTMENNLYTIHLERVIFLVRVPKMLRLIKKKFGDLVELIVEETMKSGRADKSSLATAINVKLEQMGKGNEKKVNEGTIDKAIKPGLIKLIESGLNTLDGKQATVGDDQRHYYQVDIDAINMLIMNEFIVSGVQRSIDERAGKIMAVILDTADADNDVYTTNLRKIVPEECREHLKQYLKLLSEETDDPFLKCIGEEGGGRYHVDRRQISRKLTKAAIENVVLEKFGNKALRVFRVVDEKKHVEETVLQSTVMFPAKEAKLLTYMLVESHFLTITELKKAGASTSAPAKCFHLFSIDLVQVARMVLDMCYKSVANLMERKCVEQTDNKRLLQKHERVESLKASLKASGEVENDEELSEKLQDVEEMMSPPERAQVDDVHERLDRLDLGCLQVEETLCLLQAFLSHEKPVKNPKKGRQKLQLLES